MANSTPATCLRNSLTSVLLPEPEGAEMIKRIPATFFFLLGSNEKSCPLVSLSPQQRTKANSLASFISYSLALFHVLNLFAGFFDLCLHGQAQFGNAGPLAAYAAGL